MDKTNDVENEPEIQVVIQDEKNLLWTSMVFYAGWKGRRQSLNWSRKSVQILMTVNH